jgi:hypothetical protein
MPEQEVFTPRNYQVQSDTNTGVWYTLTEQVDGTWRCNCPGFFHREECKHVERIEDGTD